MLLNISTEVGNYECKDNALSCKILHGYKGKEGMALNIRIWWSEITERRLDILDNPSLLH